MCHWPNVLCVGMQILFHRSHIMPSPCCVIRFCYVYILHVIPLTVHVCGFILSIVTCIEYIDNEKIESRSESAHVYEVAFSIFGNGRMAGLNPKNGEGYPQNMYRMNVAINGIVDMGCQKIKLGSVIIVVFGGKAAKPLLLRVFNLVLSVFSGDRTRNSRCHASWLSVIELFHLLAQFSQAFTLVQQLTALLLACNGKAAWLMDNAHGTVRDVDMLTSGAARAEALHLTLSQKVIVGIW